MPDIKPFRALRYTAGAEESGTLLAPPYDVIDAAAAERLRARNPHNAVRLVLPEGKSPGRYELAAQRLERWRGEGILEEDSQAWLYGYRQTFTRAGVRLTRRATIGELRLTPFADRRVLAHEHTHSGPKRDRLALMLACRAQLSPIFLLARDEGASIAALLRRAESDTPAFEATTPDGVQHALWGITDAELSVRLCTALTARPLLIADGHHRYETALAAAAHLPDEPRAQCVLACVVSDCDPGLILEPTHRSLARAPAGGRWDVRLAETFELENCGLLSPEEAAELALRAGGGSLCVRENASGQTWLLEQLSSKSTGEGGESESQQVLQAAEDACASLLFDRFILGALFNLDAEEAASGGLLRYHQDPAAAARAAGESGAAFFLAPVPLEAVWRLALEGRRLPPKTTYFSPKMPTGLLFRCI